jgi:Ca2+-binding EF-hand superfamily protein
MRNSVVTAVLFAFLALALTSGVAMARGMDKMSAEQSFILLDTNKDGKLSKEELMSKMKDQGKVDKMISNHDKDGDGAISKQEWNTKKSG